MGRLSILDENSAFGRLCSRAGNIILVNLLLVLTILPVVTAGAGICAACSCMMALVRYGDIAPFRDFSSGFVKHGKQASLIWFLLLLAAAFLYADFRLSQAMAYTLPAAGRICATISAAALITLSLIACWTFPVLAVFNGTVKENLRRSFVFCVRHMPGSICLLLLYAVPLILTYAADTWMPLWAFLWSFFGFALLIWLASHLYLRAFRPYLDRTEVEQAAAEERQTLTDMKRLGG